ncbi:hypothetical protein FRC12_023850 [Ceratobasidium sp. 428]|nr:hypothetical protein FRC12_023850 [Ceratobasidium sp. 428]
MAATKENPIIFYDIMATEGSWSPNTYKTKFVGHAYTLLSAAEIKPPTVRLADLQRPTIPC